MGRVPDVASSSDPGAPGAGAPSTTPPPGDSGLLERLPARDLFVGLFHLLFTRDPDDYALADQLEQGALTPRQLVEWLVHAPEWTYASPMSQLGPSVHFGRSSFIRLLPKARRILDLGGVALGDPRGAMVAMGYPYPFDEIIAVDLPSEDRHDLYQEDGHHDVVGTDRGPVRYQYHSMTDLSRYRSASFDLVYSGQSIEHVTPSEVEHVLHQVRRILKPGGCFAWTRRTPG